MLSDYKSWVVFRLRVSRIPLSFVWVDFGPPHWRVESEVPNPHPYPFHLCSTVYNPHAVQDVQPTREMCTVEEIEGRVSFTPLSLILVRAYSSVSIICRLDPESGPGRLKVRRKVVYHLIERGLGT